MKSQDHQQSRSAWRLASEHTNADELNIVGRARRNGGRLARRPPLIKQAL
jgi:hypothetical protein